VFLYGLSTHSASSRFAATPAATRGARGPGGDVAQARVGQEVSFYKPARLITDAETQL